MLPHPIFFCSFLFFRRIQSEKQRIFGTFRTFLSYSSLFNRFKPFLYFPCQSTPELQRLINDCKDGIIDTILTKSVSRFGRNTAETISLLRELKAIGVRIIFENEEIDTSKYESEFLITLIEAFAQEESYNRSENILWGLKKGMKDGTSQLYNRKCFGYRKNKNGGLEICPEEAILKLMKMK